MKDFLNDVLTVALGLAVVVLNGIREQWLRFMRFVRRNWRNL